MSQNILLQRAQANFHQGNKLRELGKIDESIQKYQRAIEIKPDFSQPMEELAKVHIAQSDFKAAIKCYRRIIGLNTENHQTYLKLAKAFLKQGKTFCAIAAYQEAIELKPDLDIKVYIKLGNLLLSEQSVDARQWIESQINVDWVGRKLKNVLENIENQQYFDAYIPLGDNCEAGMQFWRIGYNESSFFRFVASRFDVTYSILKNNFKDVFNRKYIVPRTHCNGMVVNTKYNITFHSELRSKMNDETGKQTFLSDYDFDAVFENESSKINYLIGKWNRLMQSERKILFILKNDLPYKRLREADVQKISDLFLERYTNHNFKILCIQLDKFCEPEWKNPYLINRYFSYFPERGNNMKENADKVAWNQIFSEFPLNIDY